MFLTPNHPINTNKTPLNKLIRPILKRNSIKIISIRVMWENILFLEKKPHIFEFSKVLINKEVKNHNKKNNFIK